MQSKTLVRNTLVLVFILIFHNVFLIALGNIFTMFRLDNRIDLIKEAYEEKINTLEKSLVEYQKGVSGLSIYDESNLVLSKVALRDMYDFFDVLSIATSTSVKKGSAVINEDGLVGIVREAEKKTAIVDLISSKSNISVLIGDSYGLVSGYDKKNNYLVVKNINNYSKIEDGMDVVTSGLQKIDAGIKVGKVVSSEIVGVERIVYVSPAVKIDDLNYLMVVDK